MIFEFCCFFLFIVIRVESSTVSVRKEGGGVEKSSNVIISGISVIVKVFFFSLISFSILFTIYLHYYGNYITNYHH